jgi:hypothetical protein
LKKLSRIEDDTTPLNIDRATSQDETFWATFKAQEQGQNTSNTSSKSSTQHNHRHYTCFINNGGHPTWQIIDDEKAIKFFNKVRSDFF